MPNAADSSTQLLISELKPDMPEIGTIAERVPFFMYSKFISNSPSGDCDIGKS